MSLFRAQWTGTYPDVNFGRWIIKNRDGFELDFPSNIRGKRGEGLGTRECNAFDWIEKNRGWLRTLFNKNHIETSYINAMRFYKAVQPTDIT